MTVYTTHDESIRSKISCSGLVALHAIVKNNTFASDPMISNHLDVILTSILHIHASPALPLTALSKE